MFILLILTLNLLKLQEEEGTAPAVVLGGWTWTGLHRRSVFFGVCCDVSSEAVVDVRCLSDACRLQFSVQSCCE